MTLAGKYGRDATAKTGIAEKISFLSGPIRSGTTPGPTCIYLCGEFSG
jgi:hypothetical protein